MGIPARMLLIKLPYWLGIVADALWAVALFSPKVFGLFTGRPAFQPDLEVRLIMGIGGTLMTGWTFLLIWALQDPIGRRAVILLTAFPVVFGMFLIALLGFIEGDSYGAWIMFKTAFLFVSMITSYVLARGPHDGIHPSQLRTSDEENKPMNQDLEHLKLLSIFHYVVAGLTALFACVPLFHFFLGLAIATGGFNDAPGEARLIGVLFMVFAGLFIVTGWALAGAILIAGRNLARQTRYTYCLVMAGVECIFMPFGTVLGVFTIIVLMRESVKALFGSAGDAGLVSGEAQS